MSTELSNHHKTITLVLLLTACAPPVYSEQTDSIELTYITEKLSPAKLYSGWQKLLDFQSMFYTLCGKKWGYQSKPFIWFPWARGYHLLKEQPGTVLFTIGKTKAREPLFRWVCGISTDKQLLLAKKSRNIKINNIGDARKFKIGTIHNDIGEQLLLDMNFNPKNLKPVSTALQNFKKLDTDRIDLLVYGENAAWDEMHSNSIDTKKYEIVYILTSYQSCYGFHISTPNNIIQRFQNSLNIVMQKPIFNKIFQQYFPNRLTFDSSK